MIDFYDSIFFALKACVEAVVPEVTVVPGAIACPAKFPCVAIEEANNYTVGLDSTQRERYAAVQYKITVFSNKISGKRREAMELFQAADHWLISSNFTRRSKYDTPELYTASIYQISATYDAEIGEDGQIYTKK